jgi:hypothetical protein
MHASILKSGERVHVIHRQLYEGDARRHFVGVVDACEGTLARVVGYLFSVEARRNQFVKRDGLRTRVISLDAASVIVNVLPPEVDVERVTYTYKSTTEFVVSDGSGWHLDLSHL